MVAEIEVEIMIDKDKISDKPRMDVEIVTEEVITDKTLVEVTVEKEAGKTLGETLIIIDRSRSRGRSPTPRRHISR